MLGHLVRKEILDQILSLRFLMLSLVGALLIGLSLHNGHAYYQACVKDHKLAQAATEGRFQQLGGADDWIELGAFGFKEHKPPTPMSIFIRGLDSVLGRSISNAASSAQRLRRSPAEMDPTMGLFPVLDIGFVVQVLLSLFVVVLTYDAISGEKERGTLRLLASFPLPADRLLLGKLAGALVTTLTAFGVPTVLGIAGLTLMPGVQIAADQWWALVLILVTSGVYLSVFICAGLLASTLAPRSATSFVLLLSLWVAAVVVLPRLGLIAADHLRPAISIHEHQAARKVLERQYLIKWRDLRNQWGPKHSQPGQEWWRTLEGREAKALNYEETRLDVFRQRDEALSRIDERFRNRYRIRLDLAVALAMSSPAFAYKQAVIRMAGTGIETHQRFEMAFTKGYLTGQYLPWVSRTSRLYNLRQVNPAKYGNLVWDLSDLPRFAYQPAAQGEDLQMSLIDLGVLALWGVVLFVGAWLAFGRYDPR